jgi:hypothetical protein
MMLPKQQGGFEAVFFSREGSISSLPMSPKKVVSEKQPRQRMF